MIVHHDAAEQLALNNKLMELKTEEISTLHKLADEQTENHCC